jgi:hypothetical protein
VTPPEELFEKSSSGLLKNFKEKYEVDRDGYFMKYDISPLPVGPSPLGY